MNKIKNSTNTNKHTITIKVVKTCKCNPIMNPPGACISPARASGSRDTKQEDQVRGKSRHRRVSITSVSRAWECPMKTILASRSISAKTTSSFSTERQRKGPEKSRSMWGKNRGGGTCRAIRNSAKNKEWRGVL